MLCHSKPRSCFPLPASHRYYTLHTASPQVRRTSPQVTARGKLRFRNSPFLPITWTFIIPTGVPANCGRFLPVRRDVHSYGATGAAPDRRNQPCRAPAGTPPRGVRGRFGEPSSRASKRISSDAVAHVHVRGNAKGIRLASREDVRRPLWSIAFRRLFR
jgi:hypothetical protein